MKVILLGAAPGSSYLFGSGSAAAPSIAFASSPTVGFYLASASVIGVAINGAAALRFGITGSDPYVSGVVGAGYIAFPAAGAVNIVAASTNQNITLTPSGTGQVRAVLTNGTFSLQNSGGSTIRLDSTGGMEYNVGASYLHNWTLNGANSMRLIANGNLLLGGLVVDGGNGRIQLPTHTTSAGGIAFGTGANEVLYRSAADTLTTLSTLNAPRYNSTGAASTVSAGQVSYGGTTATTVGAAGGASALPATPLGYIIVNVAGTTAKVPYYNN